MLEYLVSEQLRTQASVPDWHWFIRSGEAFASGRIASSMLFRRPRASVTFIALDVNGTYALGSDGQSYELYPLNVPGVSRPWTNYW
jgi:hypothetical protein